MKILGNRILVSRVEEPKKDGFQSVNVQDSFVYKGKVEQIGDLGLKLIDGKSRQLGTGIGVGDTILFSKYSPDTQEVEHDGKKMKIISVDDVLAVL
jgi:co-chaperonin GroES (HSP10)